MMMLSSPWKLSKYVSLGDREPQMCEEDGVATRTRQRTDYTQPVGDLKGSPAQNPGTQI